MTEKKTDPRSLRFPPRLRRLIQEEADKDDRKWQEETLYLIKLGLHVKKFNSREYL